MDPFQIGLIGLAIMVVALLLGVPVAAVLGLLGVFGTAAIIGWDGALSVATTVPFEAAADYGFGALVLFLLMGMILHESKITDGLFDCLNKWLGKFAGGLMMATSVAGGLFGAL
ncbi:MAG: TRAP transporter large permease subunit [Deltaproteobacteria bacterium]|nr:TRAP transporter large permease subunit [Deltaproteobacteria bacterium]